MASYQTFIIFFGMQTLTNGHEPDDLIQRQAQIKVLFEESELVSGDSEAIRTFSDKYIVPEKLVAGYAEYLSQIKNAQGEERGDWKGANGTAEPGAQWLGWTVQLR